MITALLDKGVIRKAYERQIRLRRGLTPTYSQIVSTIVLAEATVGNCQGYVTKETYHILMSRSVSICSIMLNGLRVLEKGKYLRRWARRLRDFGFTAEDAVILSNGIFGVDTVSRTLGVSLIVTTDLRMIANYHRHFDHIDARLNYMNGNLSLPYRRVELPELVSVNQMRSIL